MNSLSTKLWAVVWAGLSLVYGIFLLTYLNHNKKFKSQMTSRDKTFRKAAIVITWIEIVATGMWLVALMISIFSGSEPYYSPMMSSSMGFY